MLNNKTKFFFTILLIFSSAIKSIKSMAITSSSNILEELQENLIIAALNNNIGKIKEIIALDKININFQNSTENNTALMSATENGHSQAVITLLAAGADPNLVDNYGETALKIAIRNNHNLTAVILINNGTILNLPSKNPELNLAVMYNNLFLVRYLISKKAKTDLRDYQNYLPIHVAAVNGFTAIVKELISAGADINTVYKRVSPVALAIISRHYSTAMLLVKSGARLDESTTPLHKLYLKLIEHEAEDTEDQDEQDKEEAEYNIKNLIKLLEACIITKAISKRTLGACSPKNKFMQIDLCK